MPSPPSTPAAASSPGDLATALHDVNERLLLSSLREREASEEARTHRKQLGALLELRRVSPEHSERMVFISGGAFTPGAEAFLQRGPNERLDKPFEASVVRALVQRFVRARA